ncbi:MAG TPA: hypothetical protein VI357_19190 [Mycobacteriales bacterium]
MSAFTVEMQSRPGELARLCEAMAGGKINMILSAVTDGDRGTVAFVVDDEQAARTALDEAGIDFRERPAVTVRMDNLPGTGAVAFRRLADAGVNLELLLPVQVSPQEFYAVLCVDDAESAYAALRDYVVGERDFS